MNTSNLLQTVNSITTQGKGILAADESAPTIKKRFQAINLESTEENRRAYREMLFTTPGLNEYISGIILFEETLYQTTQGKKPFPKLLAELGIVPGVKVDKGFTPLANFSDDNITQGLDGLGERLSEYKKQGARFAKWRAVFKITAHNPNRIAIKSNAEVLARYAAICQSIDIVPIVEPEVLMDGDHSIERCRDVSLVVFHQVFHALFKHKIIFECMILKPSMVIAGTNAQLKATVNEVALATLNTLYETVPAAVPTINFLSGGQSSELATTHLNAINSLATKKPWNLSFSYGRALQEHALKTWNGKDENIPLAQKKLLKRAKLNSLACLGKYKPEMEKE
ncbi:MAG: fructose-bisphosphate aldolase class I [Gammaproteobacteria bacterium]|nr:fructose-bisphosphate aldolase class I [Gammaproteobacteria bacterium]